PADDGPTLLADAQDTDLSDASTLAESSTLPDNTTSMESDAGDAGPDSNGTQRDANAEGASSDSAPRDAPPEGPPCVGDLSNIGTRDFRISFSVTTSQGSQSALVNQRSTCSFGMFWDIRLENGALFIETDDGQNYMQFTTSGRAVNDGQPHAVLVRRTSASVTAQIDGAAVGTGVSRASFGRLPAVVSGMDPCQVGPMKDNTVAFTGTLTNLCVSAP
ncbi:MAG TPA: laminin G domain-containing protein, partial [Polyangiaceae bacterium]|nr:laminin G domain-containing protein [Polyangiaceae bacterium]